MNDFRELAERGIGRTESRNERLECAPVAFVSEVRFGHVEAQLARSRGFTRAHEAELRLAVDEPLNKPRAGDPVDQDTPARHPGATAMRRRPRWRREDRLGRFTRLPDLGCGGWGSVKMLSEACEACVSRSTTRGAEA